ncbi:hypothetical protein F4808DRAFT_433869 [Astrocystis sublimbata]|nr:hypothetical protein F4808DRAFT_433869 [Astrocystis sublimbata]
MSSRGTYTISLPSNMSPPNDLTSYSRSMHTHTKRQMEAANISSSSRQRGHSQSQHSPVSSMPNGVRRGSPRNGSPGATRVNGTHEYHS